MRRGDSAGPRSQVARLFSAELEHEVRREASPVATDRLVQAFGLDAVEVGEVGVQQDALAAEYLNAPPDRLFDAHKGARPPRLSLGHQRSPRRASVLRGFPVGSWTSSGISRWSPSRPATCQIAPTGPSGPRSAGSAAKSNSRRERRVACRSRRISSSVALASALARAALLAIVRTSGQARSRRRHSPRWYRSRYAAIFAANRRGRSEPRSTSTKASNSQPRVE